MVRYLTITYTSVLVNDRANTADILTKQLLEIDGFGILINAFLNRYLCFTVLDIFVNEKLYLYDYMLTVIILTIEF